jgi:hypothetical protein
MPCLNTPCVNHRVPFGRRVRDRPPIPHSTAGAISRGSAGAPIAVRCQEFPRSPPRLPRGNRGDGSWSARSACDRRIRHRTRRYQVWDRPKRWHRDVSHMSYGVALVLTPLSWLAFAIPARIATLIVSSKERLWFRLARILSPWLFLMVVTCYFYVLNLSNEYPEPPSDFFQELVWGFVLFGVWSLPILAVEIVLVSWLWLTPFAAVRLFADVASRHTAFPTKLRRTKSQLPSSHLHRRRAGSISVANSGGGELAESDKRGRLDRGPVNTCSTFLMFAPTGPHTLGRQLT